MSPVPAVKWFLLPALLAAATAFAVVSPEDEAAFVAASNACRPPLRPKLCAAFWRMLW